MKNGLTIFPPKIHANSCQKILSTFRARFKDGLHLGSSLIEFFLFFMTFLNLSDSGSRAHIFILNSSKVRM